MAAVSGGGSGSRMSLYDSLRQTNGAASLIESLQSELKQRDGEVLQLQVDDETCLPRFISLTGIYNLRLQQVRFSFPISLHCCCIPVTVLLAQTSNSFCNPPLQTDIE